MRGLEPKKQEADRVRPFVEKHKEISLKSLGWFFLHHTAVFRARARVLLVGTTERAKGKREGATWVKVTSISHPSVRLAREGGRTIEVEQIHPKSKQATSRHSANPKKENRGKWYIHLFSRESQMLFVPN